MLQPRTAHSAGFLDNVASSKLSHRWRSTSRPIRTTVLPVSPVWPLLTHLLDTAAQWSVPWPAMLTQCFHAIPTQHNHSDAPVIRTSATCSQMDSSRRQSVVVVRVMRWLRMHYTPTTSAFHVVSSTPRVPLTLSVEEEKAWNV